MSEIEPVEMEVLEDDEDQYSHLCTGTIII